MGNKTAKQTHKILPTPPAGHNSDFMCLISAGGLIDYYTSTLWY